MIAIIFAASAALAQLTPPAGMPAPAVTRSGGGTATLAAPTEMQTAPSSSCPNYTTILGDDAVELAKSIQAPAKTQVIEGIVITIKEIKTPSGTSFACEVLTDKLSGKTVPFFRGKRSSCTLTPSITMAPNGALPSGGHRISPTKR